MSLLRPALPAADRPIAGRSRLSADVRVGIVSWNTADLLDACLDALPAALGALDAEVVVVDNASSDGSADAADGHADVVVVRNQENVGYARGMNRALAGTDARALIALNPDTAPPPGSLERLVRRLDAEAGLGVVVPRLANTDGSVQHSVYRFPSLRVAAALSLLPARLHGLVGRKLWLEGHAPHTRSTDIDWAIGAVHCIRAAAITGPVYSERSFMYAEDLELCWRLHQAGWRIALDADVVVPHVANAAGAQAWGSGRTARWLDPTYDWYADARGDRQARVWALINVVGAGTKLASNRLIAKVNRRRAPEVWPRVVQFRELLPLHAHKLLHGPRSKVSTGQPPS